MELLVVIAILGIIGTIVTINLTGTLKNEQKKECEDFVSEVEEAACTYVSLNNKEIICNRNNCSPIPLSILVSEGLITRENDPCTKQAIDLNSTVIVTWDKNGKKECKYGR